MKYLRASGDLSTRPRGLVSAPVRARRRGALCPLHEPTDTGHCENRVCVSRCPLPLRVWQCRTACRGVREGEVRGARRAQQTPEPEPELELSAALDSSRSAPPAPGSSAPRRDAASSHRIGLDRHAPLWLAHAVGRVVVLERACVVYGGSSARPRSLRAASRSLCHPQEPASFRPATPPPTTVAYARRTHGGVGPLRGPPDVQVKLVSGHPLWGRSCLNCPAQASHR